jgi:two-component system phosphate regulon sensor histidine kinase PhoR
MRSIIRRASFTSRLAALAALVMVVLVVIDYIALLEVPSRIARDTVEIALRENVQSLSATFGDDREVLRVRTDDFVSPEENRDVRVAILDQDPVALQRLVDEQLGDDVEFAFLSASELDGSGVGPITSTYKVQGRTRTADVVFFQQVEDEVLERAAAATGYDASFALERDGSFVARSDRFPDSIDPDDTGTSIDPTVAELTPMRVDGEDLHLYTRAMAPDSSYQLHALSTRELEQAALTEINADVRNAIIGMSLATLAAFLLLVFFTSRTVRTFARRVRTLADGDYGTMMPVRGSDSFAELAGSVNRLSEQLEDQVGQLEDTAKAFSRTLETLEEGICVWSDEGTLSYWNRGAEQLTGLARERADVEDPVVAFLHAERAPGTRRVSLPVRRSGNGLVVDLVVTAMPGGGIVQTFRDTTMVDMLQQTQRNFMATAAHELRTPITTILGFADTLVNPDLELTDRQRQEFLGIVRDHAYELQEIADAFFTNHQLANERVEVSIVAAAVDGVVADAIERVRTAFPELAPGLEDVRVDVPDGVAVMADRRALVGVVSVLLENALKYGGAPISVAVECSGGTLALMVQDHGPGIESHHHARLFDPFYRIDVDMRSGVGGAGLGLFTARKLVEAMHGVIRVRSMPGVGSTFVVELPVAPTGQGTGDEASRLRLVG